MLGKVDGHICTERKENMSIFWDDINIHWNCVNMLHVSMNAALFWCPHELKPDMQTLLESYLVRPVFHVHWGCAQVGKCTH